MFENIDRIRTPSVEKFVEEYVRRHRPVILTDLFPPEVIRKLGTARSALHHLGGKKIEIQEPYMDTLKKQLKAMAAGSPLELRKEVVTIRRFLDTRLTVAGDNRMCIEQPVPADLDGLLPIPPLCRDAEGTGFRDLEGRLFVGRAGNVAHLHFDSDQRQVIQLHLFGAKRIILIPPDANARLVPFRNFSSWHLEHLSEEERDDFVRQLGGYQCRLRPGECLFMPALIWHYLQYEENGLSLSLRFRRNEFNKFLGTHCHASYHLQPFAWRLVDETSVAEPHRKAYREIVRAAEELGPSPYEKGKSMEGLFRRINRELFPRLACSERVDWLDELGVTDRLREWEINTKGLYGAGTPKALEKAA